MDCFILLNAPARMGLKQSAPSFSFSSLRLRPATAGAKTNAYMPEHCPPGRRVVAALRDKNGFWILYCKRSIDYGLF